jgi:hypothetical protein
MVAKKVQSLDVVMVAWRVENLDKHLDEHSVGGKGMKMVALTEVMPAAG